MSLLIPYVKLSWHVDPLFPEFTYGDSGNRARRLKKLARNSYVFFHTTIRGKKYITAFYVVDRVLDTTDACRDRLIANKFNNPHILECKMGDRPKDGEDDVVLFGDPITSRILERPLLFDRKLASKLSLGISFKDGRSEAQMIGSATRAWRSLSKDDIDCLLREIEESQIDGDTRTLRSSEEVSETLERDIERYLIKHPKLLGSGLRFLESQRRTSDGRLDLLFEDSRNDLIVVEIKLGRIGRDAVRQTRNYVRDLQSKEKKKVSGIIVCAGVMQAYEEELRRQKEVRIFVHGWSLAMESW